MVVLYSTPSLERATYYILPVVDPAHFLFGVSPECAASPSTPVVDKRLGAAIRQAI
jgi:hypothetical protein